MVNQEQTIAVFFNSQESMDAADFTAVQHTVAGLRKLRYPTIPIFISQNGRWYVGPRTSSPDDGRLASAEYFETNIKKKLSNIPEHSLNLSQSTNGKLVIEYEGWLTKKSIEINATLMVSTGLMKNAGEFIGLFELAKIPFVGPGRITNATTLDKVITKLLCRQFDIPTADFIYVTKSEWAHFSEELLEQASEMGFPLFVKSAKNESVQGKLVADTDELRNAIEHVLQHDSKALIEWVVPNMLNLTLAAVMNSKGKTEISEVRTLTASDDRSSYDAGLESPELPKEVVSDIQDLARQSYRSFECDGMVRFNFFYNQTGRNIYLSKINCSIDQIGYQLWEESGVSREELLKKLLKSIDLS